MIGRTGSFFPKKKGESGALFLFWAPELAIERTGEIPASDVSIVARELSLHMFLGAGRPVGLLREGAR